MSDGKLNFTNSDKALRMEVKASDEMSEFYPYGWSDTSYVIKKNHCFPVSKMILEIPINKTFLKFEKPSKDNKP